MALKDGLNVMADHLGQVIKGIDMLRRTLVMVGVPEAKTGRQSGAITNAALAYIHDNGAPEAGIPARPFMVPGIKRAEALTTAKLTQAGELAMDGKPGAAAKAMAAAGQAAVNEIRNTVREGIPPPLAPATVTRRRVRSPGSSYRRKAATSAQTTPLIDTAQMINALAYVVRKVGK